MPRITSLEELHKLRIELIMAHNRQASGGARSIRVGMGTCGIAVGAADVYRALEEGIREAGLNDVSLSEIGCIGLCSNEPIVEVLIGTEPKVSYGRVNPEIAKRILDEHIKNGKPVVDYVIDMAPFPTI